MKVLLVNGSPHPKGCIFTALTEIASTLEKHSIETEIYQLGLKPISGCMGCNKCNELDRCIIDDKVNDFVVKAADADGFIFGSPVHYAAASGTITSFLDRVFYSGGDRLTFKPGSVIVSCRRAGSTAALDQLMKYLTINNMPVVSSQYWNMVHGFTPEDVRKDLEGLHTMRTLGHNMAWLLKCIEAGKKEGYTVPEREEKVWTNFIH